MKTKKTKTKTKTKITCKLPNNRITYKCTPSLTSIWKNDFNGTYKITKYDIYFTFNKKTVRLHTNKDSSSTWLLYDNKYIEVYLDINPYKILKKIMKIMK